MIPLKSAKKIKPICKVGQSYNLLLHFISYIFPAEFDFDSALVDLGLHICNFPFSYSGRRGDMVSYERPIWEFVFDRVAAPDKKSILLVMYSDLFTARSRTSSAACRKSLQIPTRVGPTSFRLEWFFVDFLVGNFFRVDFFGIFWYTIQPQILRFFACHFQDWETRW